MANRHFRKIRERAAAQAEPEAREVAPVPGTYLVTSPDGSTETREVKKGEALEVKTGARIERVSDKPASFAPYSVGVNFADREAGKDNFGTGAEAIAYAGLALADKAVGVEISDRQNNLVASGNIKDGLRIFRRLDCEPGKPPAFTVEKSTPVPQRVMDTLRAVEKPEDKSPGQPLAPYFKAPYFTGPGGEVLKSIGFVNSDGEASTVTAVQFETERGALK